ncbi:hypothetical protein [Streptomyces flavofungini]|nr:hypothetical protein [Streptomyces flavofungini]WJV50122.1 hypothetical protein QUY26_34135 [Streptomyces flavofungini]
MTATTQTARRRPHSLGTIGAPPQYAQAATGTPPHPVRPTDRTKEPQP